MNPHLYTDTSLVTYGPLWTKVEEVALVCPGSRARCIPTKISASVCLMFLVLRLISCKTVTMSFNLFHSY